MSLTPAGEAVISKALSGRACLLSNGVEIEDAGQEPVRFDTDGPQEVTFGPATHEWWVTHIGVIRQGARMLAQRLEESAHVDAGRELVLRLQLTAELEE